MSKILILKKPRNEKERKKTETINKYDGRKKKWRLENKKNKKKMIKNEAHEKRNNKVDKINTKWKGGHEK